MGDGALGDIAFVSQVEAVPGAWTRYVWRDMQVPNGRLRYRVVTCGIDGGVQYSAPVSITHLPPARFDLFGCFPSPSPGELHATFVVPDQPAHTLSPQATILAVYDLQGRLVRTVLNKVLPGGSYTAAWDGLDDNGQGVSSGVYLCVLRQRTKSDARRMVLLR